MKRLAAPIAGLQNLLIVIVLVFFTFDCTTQSYTDFVASPPNLADKVWYLGEAFIFLLFGIIFAALNQALYRQVWVLISFFFLIRFLWVITWVTFGLSANMNIAQTVMFGVILSSITFITLLPYLKKIFKDTA